MKRTCIFLIILSALFISLSVCVSAQAADIAYVTADVLNIRSGASLDADVVAKAYYGAKVTILSSYDGWHYVRLENGTEGHASLLYISYDAPSPVSSGSLGASVAEAAKNYLGCKYVYGGEGASTFDCSGFTMFMMKKYGVSLPHSASAQSACGVGIAKSDLAVGDLVFFATLGKTSINHVGIYIGDGNFIHASSGKGSVVISDLSEGYYYKCYKGACRVL
ncbi:MAG: NlpC/P60 family protein [Clostridia bacterium]|nr:NlpC/P60 family protein [Clostridia bacterium]